MKFLVIRFSSIGDIILTTPIIRCLKIQKDVEVHYLTKKSFTSLLQQNPYITKIWSIQKSIREVIPALRKEGFTHIIDLHKNFRSTWLNLSLRGKYLTFDKLNPEKWLFVNFKLDLLPIKHLVDRYFEALSVLGIRNDGAGLDYFLPQNEEIDLASENTGGRFICFVVGGGHATKKMTAGQISDICRQLPLPVVLLGGKEDSVVGDYVLSKNNHVSNWCGKTTIHGSASLIRQCSLLITHDTGMMHIGAALKKKIISIWGNTVPKFGMFPYYPESQEPLNKIIEIHNLPCRPCSKIGYSSCPKGHFNCIKEIKPGRIAQVARDLLSDNIEI